MRFITNRLIEFDQRKVQINVKYKGQDNYGTAIGGLGSIVGFILIGFFLFSECYAWLYSPRYS